MEKHIQYEIISGMTGGDVSFRIINQTHRRFEFGDKNTNIWEASNHIFLKSQSYPEIDGDVLFVQGKDPFKDNEILLASSKFFKRYKEAMDEYNEKFGFEIQLPKDLFTI